MNSAAPAKFRPILQGFVDTVSKSYRICFQKNSALIENYRKLLAQINEGGSAEARRRHVEINKKILVRDRLKALLDPGAPFMEFGALAGWGMDYGDLPAAGIVLGIGQIHQRYCVILANDATVKGGTIYPIAVKKQLRGQAIASQLRIPCIALVDSGGAFLPLQAEIFPDSQHGGRVFYNEAVMGSQRIPQIAVVCGSCTAGAAYIPTLADDAIIVDKIGSLFLGGPPLVKAALGESISSEALGGASVHCFASGCTDYFARTEAEAFDQCRDVVAALNFPPRKAKKSGGDFSEPEFATRELDGLAGAQEGVENLISSVLARLLDGSRFAEFRRGYGASLCCGFGELGGHLIAIVAQRHSPIDMKSATKVSQLVQMANQRQIPLLFLQNSGDSSLPEKGEGCSPNDPDRLKAVAQLIACISCSPGSPKISLNIGGCFGEDLFAMCGRAFDPVVALAWPNARMSFGEVSSSRDETTKEDDEMMQTLFADGSSAFHAASRLWTDVVVVPSETRQTLINVLDLIDYSINELKFVRSSADQANGPVLKF